MALTSLLYAKDQRFDSAAFAPLSVLANTLIEIYPKGSVSQVTWTEEEGSVVVDPTPIWKGWAAITPNKDWRARDRRWTYVDTAVHAYRVQLWHRKMNLLYEKSEWETAETPQFKYGQIVKVLENASDPTYVGLQLVVRNAITDSDQWQPTLLCDMSTGDPDGD